MKRPVSLLAAVALLAALTVIPATPALAREGLIQKAARGHLHIPLVVTRTGSHEAPSLSDGLIEAAEATFQQSQATGTLTGASATTAIPGPTGGTLGCGTRNPGGNVRVNQDCTFRRQAEELIKFNPANPQNLVAGQNDSRVGFNHCGFDYSFDGGKTWGDGIPPFFQRINNPPAGHTVVGGAGTGHTYDAASDPALAVDSQGIAFYSCILFDVNTDASAVVVTSSPLGAGGTFYNNVAGGTAFIVAEDNSAGASHDKQFLAADTFTGSPFRDQVYVTWTVFVSDPRCISDTNPDGFCESPIFFSRSADHAQTWSAPVEISGRSGLCTHGNAFDELRNPNDCDLDQGSDPVVLPSGAIVVPFTNRNTEGVNVQQLAVISTDGGNTWSAPIKVADVVQAGAPRCSFGRLCIPGAFVRTNSFPRSAVNRGNGNLYVTWQDYRDGEWDIRLAASTDGGKTWQQAGSPVNSNGQDHYFPAIDVVPGTGTELEGDHLAISYYRTDRVPNENTPGVVFAPGQPGVQQEPSDYTLAGGFGLSTSFHEVALTGQFPPPVGIQAGFNGDYSGLVVVGGRAQPIWSDTRNTAPAGQVAAGPAPDEDVFTDNSAIP